MDKKDLIFLAAAHATTDKFSGKVDAQVARDFFMHWHQILSDLYDELPKINESDSYNERAARGEDLLIRTVEG